MVLTRNEDEHGERDGAERSVLTRNEDEHGERDGAERSLAAVTAEQEGENGVEEETAAADDPENLHRQPVLAEFACTTVHRRLRSCVTTVYQVINC